MVFDIRLVSGKNAEQMAECLKIGEAVRLNIDQISASSCGGASTGIEDDQS